MFAASLKMKMNKTQQDINVMGGVGGGMAIFSKLSIMYNF